MPRLTLWLTLALATVLAVSGCGPSTSSSTSAAPAPKAAQPAAPTKVPNPAASSTVDGIRLTVDGKTVDLPGDVKVTRQSVSGVGILYLGKNPSPSALVGGNGVMLELQSASGKDGFPDGFSARDVQVATFTVWKGVEFWYMSTQAMPGKAIADLVISHTSGKVAGSFEDGLTGTPGKIRARIDFGVPFPQ